MLDFNKHAGPKPKCFFTQSSLPTYVNHEEPSTKRKPFSTILSQRCCHTLDIILPQKGARALQSALAGGKGTLQYARVHMKLGELIDGDFFNDYIKSGNILMLSEGRPGIDYIFMLADGLLRLEVDKPTYERLGLEGKVIASLGRKHVKARYAIEINLRLPSMLHGKKGFERIVWAFKNVLNHSMTWLFYDLKAPTDGTGPLAAFSPVLRKAEPDVATLRDVLVPPFPGHAQEEDHEAITETLEWLSLVFSGSPRVMECDSIDTYLSRYRVPHSREPNAEGSACDVQQLVNLQWHGFLSSNFVTKMFLAALKTSGDDWFALSASGFGGQTYVVLKTDNRSLTWEYEG